LIAPVLKDALLYANLILMLTVGFTLAYLTAKIPNFSHGTLAGIGVYLVFSFTRLFKLNPYLAMPVAFLVGGAVGVFIYRFVIGTLRKHGATAISLSIATLAVELIVLAVLNIYADYITILYGHLPMMFARIFLLSGVDFKFMDLPGVLIVSTAIIVFLVVGLHLMLTRTRFGISMRATVEDPSLASILGTNVELVSTISWLLTGGLAGLAGAMLPLWFQGDPYTGGRMMTSVFAASVLGGLSSIYGAMLGGYLIGLIEILGTAGLVSVFGLWIASYRMLIPLVILSLVLLKAPGGIVGLIQSLRTWISSKRAASSPQQGRSEARFP